MAASSSYHIARNGKIARCKAQPGQCPLGGKHFADKKVAKFYAEQGWDKLEAQEAAVAKEQLREISREELSERLGLLDTYTTLLRGRDRNAPKKYMQELTAAGYSKEDQGWNHDLLLAELQRRVAIDRETPGTLEYNWQKRIKGYEEMKALGFDEVNRRVTQLERMHEATEAGNTSLANGYANGLRLQGYDPESPAWQLAPLRTQQQENMQANEAEHALRAEAIRSGVARP